LTPRMAHGLTSPMPTLGICRASPLNVDLPDCSAKGRPLIPGFLSVGQQPGLAEHAHELTTNLPDAILSGRSEIHITNLTRPLGELKAAVKLGGAGAPEPTSPSHRKSQESTGKDTRKRREPLTRSIWAKNDGARPERQESITQTAFASFPISLNEVVDRRCTAIGTEYRWSSLAAELCGTLT
jgi:hypothetical protein